MNKKVKNQIKIGNNNRIINSNFGGYNENKVIKKRSILGKIFIGVIVSVIGGIVVGIIMQFLT